MSTFLDQYIARFQNMPSFNIHAVSNDGMKSSPWFQVDPTQIVKELVLDELNVGGQVQVVTGEIQKWGRLLAQTRRIWELHERAYRAWRSQFTLDAMKSPADDEEKDGWGKTAKGESKAPTKEVVESLYRVHPEYHACQVAIEQAEEVHNSVNAIYEAFRAKKDMLKSFAYRNNDGGSPQLSV